MPPTPTDPPLAWAPEFPDVRPVSPLRLFAVTMGLVFLTELLIMIGFEEVWQAPERVEILLDSLILAAVTGPLLFATLYRPLTRYVHAIDRAGEALRYSEQKYQAVVDNSPAGIFIHRRGRIVFSNRRAAELFEVDGPSLEGVDPEALVAEEHLERFRKLLAAPAESAGTPEPIEFRVDAPTGGPRWVRARAGRLPYREGHSVLVMLVDVTRQRRLEEEVAQLSLQRLRVQEEERGRLARELHDGLGQSLTGIKFLLEHTLGRVHPVERREQSKRLRALVPRLQEAVEEVRRISMALRPATLDDLGLVATVTWFLRETQATFPHLEVKHRLKVDEADIPDERKIVIYRTLQEAVTNAAKHCGRCGVEVALEQEGGGLRLTVADDGDGFDPASVLRRDPASRGVGLGSMRERVELSGGEFELEARPGSGTRVRAAWPAVRP